MSPRSENFYLSGPNPRVTIDWNNVYYRRLVLASLVKGANVLERDRLEKRDEIQALAPPWWKSFHFELYHQFIDKTGSIFGAIYVYMYPYPVPNSPQYVIAFRGTILKKGAALRDIKSNLKCLFNELHRSPCFEEAMYYVRKLFAEGSRVWLAGHSLGSARALLVGKNMAKMGVWLEAYLFNPPVLSFPIETVFKDERLKFGIRCVSSVVRAGFSRAVYGRQRHHEAGVHNNPFVALSFWVPYLFVNPDDPICSEYIGYFGHRIMLEESGLGTLDRRVTKSHMDSGSEPLHLIPSADLTINRGQLTEFQGLFCAFKKLRRAHGIRQWWNYVPCDSLRYEY